MKAWLKRFKLVSTGRTAVSMPSMLLYLPASFIFALEREFVLAPDDFNNRLRIVLAGELTSFLFLHICALTVLKNRKYREQSLILCLFVWATTGVVRGFFAEFYASSILNYQSYAWNRILPSVAFSTLGLAFAAYSFGSVYAIETKKSALRSLNGFIMRENADLNMKQNDMKEEAIVTLQESLVPKVIQLQNLAAGLKAIDRSIALQKSLQSLEEQAHRLAYQMRLNLDKLESIPNPRTGLASRLLLSSKRTIHIWPNRLSIKLSLLFISIGGVIVQFGRNSESGALSALLGTVLLGLVLVTFERLLKLVKDAQKQFVFVASYLTVFAVQYLYASKFVPLAFNLEQPVNPWYSSAKITFAVFLASSFLSFLEKDSAILKSMTEQSTTSREVLNVKSERNEILESVNTLTNQGALQGQISGVLLSLNLLTKDEDLNSTKVNAVEIIENANILLAKAINEITKLSV